VILVGLTGGIGAGKSTVSAMLSERGAAIVDAGAEHLVACHFRGADAPRA
jgi:dephospho-CoA kinase